MNPGRWQMADGGWRTRSVLECGDESPLFPSATQSSDQSEHSKTWRSPRRLLFCFVLLHSAFCLCANAQSYSIDWWTVNGGGGGSTGGVYTVTGTIGQPDAGAMSGGNYTLQGGFWGIVAAVQTPGAPVLTITRSNTTVVVSWPLPAEGWVLEWTNRVDGVSAPWPQIPPPYQTNGSNLQVTEPFPAGNRFYRLRKP